MAKIGVNVSLHNGPDSAQSPRSEAECNDVFYARRKFSFDHGREAGFVEHSTRGLVTPRRDRIRAISQSGRRRPQ